MRVTKTALILMFILAFSLPALAELNVVATASDLAAIAKEVGGEHVKVTALVLPTQDPHFVDAKPSLALKLARADLLLHVGLELESGWLPPLLVGSRNSAIQTGGDGNLDCSTLVKLLEVPGEKIDRSMGDIHPGGNPHYYFDPRRMIVISGGIAERMAALDPENAEIYRANRKAWAQKAADAVTGWEEKLRPYRGAEVLAYHASYPYLADWLGLSIIAHLEPKPGIPPSARHVAKVVGLAKDKQVSVILQEAYYPDNTSKIVAQKIGAQVVRIPGGADVQKGETYLSHIDQVIDRLHAALAAGKEKP